MLGWSVSAELFSLILLLIIMFNFYEKRWTISPSSRIYSVCLWLSLASIVLNLICVGTLAHPAIIPVWVNFILNSSYFLLVNLLSTTMAYYLFYLVLEHVYNRHCIWRATAVLFFLSGLFLLILSVSLQSVRQFRQQGKRGIEPVGYCQLHSHVRRIRRHEDHQQINGQAQKG